MRLSNGARQKRWCRRRYGTQRGMSFAFGVSEAADGGKTLSKSTPAMVDGPEVPRLPDHNCNCSDLQALAPWCWESLTTTCLLQRESVPMVGRTSSVDEGDVFRTSGSESDSGSGESTVNRHYFHLQSPRCAHGTAEDSFFPCLYLSYSRFCITQSNILVVRRHEGRSRCMVQEPSQRVQNGPGESSVCI